MPYIGRGLGPSGAFRILDDLSLSSHTSGGFNGSRVTFALTVGTASLTVGLPETLIIAVDGVIQEAGSAYTISGSNIVFGSAPQDAATFWGVELGDVGGIAQQAVTQSASDDSTSIATTAYVDNQIDVQLTAEDLDVTGDSGTIAIDLDSEALAITGGAGITTTASGNAVNIVGHVEAHTVASHSDTTGTGPELETLTDGSNAESLHTHTHTAASHSDVTATGAELNLLDGVSGLVQADFTKLAAVDSTAVELNLLNGVSGLVQADLTKLAAVDSSAAELNLLDGVSGLVQADLTKLAAIDATAAEIDLLDALDQGSIIYGNSSGATTVLGQGGADTVLTSDGTNIAWQAAAGGGTSPTQVMAYETPSNPQQRAGIGYSVKESSEGNFTTNNTNTHQQIITLDITIGAAGERSAIQYGFIATARIGSAGPSKHFQPQIDAIAVNMGTNGLSVDQAIGGYNENCSFTGMSGIISPRSNAGGTNSSHAVRMTVKVSAGTVTVYRSAATKCILWAMEVRAQHGSLVTV